MPRTRTAKSSPYSVILRFDAELRATIRGAARLKGLKQQLSDGQFCISPSMDVDGAIFMLGDLYPDMMPKCVFQASLRGNLLTVKLLGDHTIDASDFATDPDFRAAADAGAPLLARMCDADLEPIVVDGESSDTQAVGTLRCSDSKPARDKTDAPAAKRGKDPLAQALGLALAPADDVPALAKRLAKRGEALDYALERQLEQIAAALSADIGSVTDRLASLGADLKTLGESIRTTFLEGVVPSSGSELKVRAAEALGAWSIASGEPKRVIVKRLGDKRFEHRMWAAQAVRASGWKDSAALLKPLARDRFCDSDGCFLVREAAGIVADHE